MKKKKKNAISNLGFLVCIFFLPEEKVWNIREEGTWSHKTFWKELSIYPFMPAYAGNEDSSEALSICYFSL